MNIIAIGFRHSLRRDSIPYQLETDPALLGSYRIPGLAVVLRLSGNTHRETGSHRCRDVVIV